MTALRLEVEKPYPNDSGCAIARLDPDTISHLGLNPDDSVEIKGTNTTVANVKKTDRQDWHAEIVRIDVFTRQNADVDIGENVEIRKADITKADSVTFKSFEKSPVQFGSNATGLVKDKILRRPVMECDIVPVMLYMNHSSGQAVPLLTVATEPQGIVRVVPETTVVIRESDKTHD